MTIRTVIRFGRLCLAGGALAFLGVFAYLAARFRYPNVLDGPAATVFPSLLATGQQGRLVWGYLCAPPTDMASGWGRCLRGPGPVPARHSPRAPSWIGWVGVATAASGLVGMFRNFTGVEAPIAALNNYLLPACMMIIGIALVPWPEFDDAGDA